MPPRAPSRTKRRDLLVALSVFGAVVVFMSWWIGIVVPMLSTTMARRGLYVPVAREKPFAGPAAKGAVAAKAKKHIHKLHVDRKHHG